MTSDVPHRHYEGQGYARLEWLEYRLEYAARDQR